MKRRDYPSRNVLLAILTAITLSGLASACGGSTPSNSTAPSFSSSAPLPTANAGAALRDLAGSRYFGTAIAMPQLVTDDRYAEIAGAEFSSTTPENGMKWGLVEPIRGQFDWGDADRIVDFGAAHNQKIRGHNLVWYQQLPGWLSGGSFDKQQLSDILQQHIATEVGRYAGKIYAWDVVNEPIADDGTLRKDIFLQTMGEEYIADAFRWARAADPSAKLYVNDYDVEGTNAKSDGLYNLVKSLKSQGVPIDGVGFQGHFDLSIGVPSDMIANLRRFADLGVDVAITELDVRMNTPATTTELARQADAYGQTVAACLAVPSCVGVTVWGFTDRYSWVPMTFPSEGAADLYDSNLDAKPALAAVQKALAGR